MDVILDGQYKEFSIPIDILPSLKEGKFGKDSVHRIQTLLSTKCLNRGHENATLDLAFTFNYNINAKKIGEEKEYILSKTSTKFKHTYEIEGGPAPTNVLVPIFIYVPKILNASQDDIKIQPSDVTNNCTLQSSDIAGRNYARLTVEGSPDFCKDIGEEDTQCDIFQCELKTGFGVADAKLLRVNVNLKFSSNGADGFEGGKIPISTALKVKDDPNSQIARSTFIKQEFTVGNLLEYWPIGVGILISFIILIAVCFIMYKKNVFSKLRFARNAMEAKDRQEAKEQQDINEEQAPMLQ